MDQVDLASLVWSIDLTPPVWRRVTPLASHDLDGLDHPGRGRRFSYRVWRCGGSYNTYARVYLTIVGFREGVLHTPEPYKPDRLNTRRAATFHPNTPFLHPKWVFWRVQNGHQIWVSLEGPPEAG